MSRRYRARRALRSSPTNRWRQLADVRATVRRARSAVPAAAVAAILVTGTAVAVGTDSLAETAEPSSAPPAGASAAAEQAAQRADRPNRSTGRPALSEQEQAQQSRTVALQKKHEAAQRRDAKNAKSGLDAALSKVSGHRYLTTDVRIRNAPKDSAAGQTVWDKGKKVAITSTTEAGFTQIAVEDEPRWVKNTYLSISKPKKSKSAKASDSSGSSGSSSSSKGGSPKTGKACSGGSSVEDGLTPDAIAVHRAICAAFPQVKSYGGVRADSLPEHPSGRALDAMTSSSSTGWEIARWVRAHRKELGVSQVLYAQKIWTVQRNSEGWRSMPDRGSATANHYDHVHVTVYGNAATG